MLAGLARLAGLAAVLGKGKLEISGREDGSQRVGECGAYEVDWDYLAK
jgi:hypothetical protein